MTIDEAIKHCLEVAEEQEKDAEYHREWHESYDEKDCRERATYHRQLAEWLTDYKELKNSIGAVKLKDMKEAAGLLQELNTENDQLTSQLVEVKRLLKAAVEDMRWVNENTQDADGACVMRKGEGCGDCPLDINGDLWCKWKREAEALKLIGD